MGLAESSLTPTPKEGMKKSGALSLELPRKTVRIQHLTRRQQKGVCEPNWVETRCRAPAHVRRSEHRSPETLRSWSKRSASAPQDPRV